MPTRIVAEHPDTLEARTLIAELDAPLIPLYLLESKHGLNVEQLLREAVAFFVIRRDEVAAGCGGLKLFGRDSDNQSKWKR